MAEITTTQSFSDGDTVTATKLNNIQGNASIQPEAITNRTAETSIDQTNDLLLIYDASATSLKKITPSNLIKAGTASDFPITGNATIGGTLGVSGTFNSTKATGTGLAVTSDATIGGTLAVTGAITATSAINGTTIPTTKTLVTTIDTQTLTNKTLTTPVISSISNTGTLTLPTSTDTLVGRATTDTLTNKTLTSPVISSISNTGTITLPTSTDTLVGRATTDTLTNKTLTSPAISGGTINNATIGATTASSASFTTIAASGLITASGGVTGNVTGNCTGSSGSCTGNSATATTASACSGNSATATTAASCSGNSATATTASACSGNSATATTASACSGNSATATTLQTARTINGISFNGSAPIITNPSTGAYSNGYGTRTVQSGGSPSGGSDGDIVYIY
jgi:hypothetical protein